MAYETAITIKKAIDNIKKRYYVLPSIQREFVWKPDQITRLFDSLMRGYPIGTFLFWKVDKDKIKDFEFYEFLKKYHEADRKHNQKADLSDNQDIIALLDGQQRMTSLYLALRGTYADKKPHMFRKNPKAYPERKLYLNLLKPLKSSDELEEEYDFRFLTQEDAANNNQEQYWFPCSEIMNFEEKHEIYDYLEDKDLTPQHYKKSITKFARNTLNRFHDVIYKDGTISFYQEEDEELDKVLQIFIRINSGGTKLSYSDLLLSIATAKWEKKDAREVIHEFVDAINKIGDGFSFDKDLVLKTCLVLADFPNVKFKVDNFNKQNMGIIEENWENTSSALWAAIELVAKLGYNEKNLTASNAVIPIAYFILKNECSDHIVHAGKWEKDRKAIKEWLARVLLRGTFGSQSDSIYPKMRNLIKDNPGQFPLKEIIASYKGTNKSISFGSDDIDNLLELKYREPRTYCALTLIYPALYQRAEYHQDHIHPKSDFNKNSMRSAGFSEEQIAQFHAGRDRIANLQLLEKTENTEKNKTPFQEWLDTKYPEKPDRERYLEHHYISPNQSLEFKDFSDFIDARRKKLKTEFQSILGVTSEETDNE